MKSSIWRVLAILALCLSLAPISVFAESSAVVSLNAVASVEQGGTVEISGTSNLDEVIIKVLRPGNAGTVYYDIVKVEGGQFTASFTLAGSEIAGTYTIVAGQSNQVATQQLVVTEAEVDVPVTPPVDPVITGPGDDNPGEEKSGETDLPVTIGDTAGESVATATTEELDGKVVVTAKVDAAKLTEQLANAQDKAVVTIPVAGNADKVTAVLTGDAVQALDAKHAVLNIQTPNGSYKLPASEVKIDLLAALLGGQGEASEISIHVDIAKSDAAKVELLADAADQGKFTVVVPPVDFTVTATLGESSVTIDTFSTFVEREIPLPEGVDASQITTAVVLNDDGTTRAVPTKIVTRDGKSYVVINSLTNSTYSVISNPVEFTDVANHWSKDAVNDMGSRMVISGVGNGLFHPEADITRAEFAAIIVRGLGLKLEGGASAFPDVSATDWYNSAINTAHANDLIGGYEDGTFRPNDKITREQAMAIIGKAMAVTGLQEKLTVQSTEIVLLPFTDASSVSGWARDGVAASVQSGIVSGRGDGHLAPQDNMTRAEVAVIVQRLLQKSELI